MSTSTALSNEQNLKINAEGNSNPKSSNGNPSTNPSYRSFGRELSNFDAKVESTTDTSKSNVNPVQIHKENYTVTNKSSGMGETELERGMSKLAIKKEQVVLKDPQSRTSINNKSSEEELFEYDEEESFDVDLERAKDPQFVYTYVKEIFDYLRESEGTYNAQIGYMAIMQTDINEKMRSILVDWLVDVHLKFKLLPETLFLTINLIDRYLERVPVSRQKLQLVGVGAMLIAAKYEEIYPPEVKEFEYVTDRAYNKEEILEMEGKILGCLNFNLTTTSSLRFLERYALIAKLDEKMMNMAKYLLELAMVEYKMLKYNPSNIACSAIYLIHKIHKIEGWSHLMSKQANYSESQLRPCAKDLCILLQTAGKNSLQAVKRKFSSSKYTQASKIQIEKA